MDNQTTVDNDTTDTKGSVTLRENSEDADSIKCEKRGREVKSLDVKPYVTEDEGRYGWLNYTPDWLQRFNNPTGFLVSFGLFSITQGMLVNGLINVSLSTLERRFELTSFELGIIGCSYDIAFFALCLFVTYYGNHAHRPRLLAIGSVILGFGAIIFALPHFVTGPYQYDTGFSDVCSDNPIDCSTSGEDSENLHAYLYVFIVGQLLHGAGATPLYTLGYSFIEDSVRKEQASWYLGLANALSIFGPVLGYVFGGGFLFLYVDFEDPEAMDQLTLEPSDPRWVGAWWIGMLLSAAMAFVLVTGPMSGFPKQLPGTAYNRAMRESEVHAKAGAEITEQEGFGKTFKDFPIAMINMLRNPTLMFITLAGCSETLVISGFATFLPKLIQTEFRLSAGTAAFLAGCISVPGGVIGHLLAGYIVKKYKMTVPGILKYCLSCCLIVIVLSPILLLHCDASVIAGVNTAYEDSQMVHPPSNLTSTCNYDCKCQEAYFKPVCGDDKIGYFSPCQAGCTGYVEDDAQYNECGCISSGNSTATEGLCEDNCNLVAPFLIVFFIVVMVCFMSTVPALVVTFRCVPDSQRSFAIGVQWMFMRALGSIPGPIAFGAVIDTTCILWQERLCGAGRGSCWIYDNARMGLSMLLIGIAGKFLSIVFFASANYFYIPIKSHENDEVDVALSDEEKIGTTDDVASAYVNRGFDDNDQDEPATEL